MHLETKQLVTWWRRIEITLLKWGQWKSFVHFLFHLQKLLVLGEILPFPDTFPLSTIDKKPEYNQYRLTSEAIQE